MPINSIDNLLSKFPHFLDKRPVSNFYKSQHVTNEQFKDIYQSLFNVIESFQLDKKLCIWKEQDEPYVYSINFVAMYPHLKTVKCYKNDELLYIENYEDTGEITSFFYSYDFPQENDDFVKIIPDDTFKIQVETYDELTLSKGFPENDTEQGNIYDHDYSLDEIGTMHGIPRKEYISTLNYSQTEPPYNDRFTEDDYHYMNRISNYLQLLRDSTPLPVAEIWKLYGLDAEMLNRERLLAKMFDITYHSYDEDTYKVEEWAPNKWEHKDGFCAKSTDSLLFFVTPSSLRPEKHKDVTFYFKFLNSLVEEIEEDFLIDIYYNNEKIEEDYDSSSIIINASSLDETETNKFTFVAKKSDGTVIDTISIDIVVKGCNDGDFYVSADGDDGNDGTKDNPFKTITQAISKLSSAQDLIVIIGEIELDKLNIVTLPCTIMGCSNAKINSNLNHNKFFRVAKNNKITLIDLDLSHNYAEANFYSEDYINKNDDINNFEDVIIHGGTPLLTLTTPKDDYYHFYDNVHLTGLLLNNQENPIKNTDLDLYVGSTLLKSVSTDNEGKINEWIHHEGLSKNTSVTYSLKFNGSDVFYELDTSKTVFFSKDTSTTTLRYGRLLTITSAGHIAGETISLYENINNQLERIKTGGTDENGEVSFTYLPEYGEHLLVFSEDGQNIIKEDIVDVRFYISDLDTDYLVTDVTINDNGELYVSRTPLSDFNTLADLENVIVDLSIDINGKFYKTNFQSNNQTLLTGNEIYPNDLEILKYAITDVSLSDNGLLEMERIDINMEVE